MSKFVKIVLISLVLAGIIAAGAGCQKTRYKPTIINPEPKPQIQPVLAFLNGTDFEGGAWKNYTSVNHGKSNTNFVYAKPTGDKSSMQAVFNVKELPSVKIFLHLTARDDDLAGKCRVLISINGKAIFEGENEFPENAWQTKMYEISQGVLKVGENDIVIANLHEEGRVGVPPWFMIATCVVGTEKYSRPRDIMKDFYVELPKEKLPLPTPLKDGEEPGFAIRGTKGWMWTAEQYLAEIPTLAKYKMNFLMNCYGSMFTKLDPWTNEWWLPMTDEKKQQFKKIVESCKANNIDFCFSVHPQLHSPKPLNPLSDEDFELFWVNFQWAQSIGVKWFCVALDDVHVSEEIRIDGTEHAKFINKLFARLKEKDPDAQFVFCPTWYWGDGTGKEQKPYLEQIAKELDKDVYLFWTGNSVVGQITRDAAETFKGISKHRIILWDNYPVNDGWPTLHLGPVVRRDLDLNEVIDGYMSNPMYSQNQINRIPLLTCADYAYNPKAYDPARSIGQAIMHIGDSDEERLILKELVEAYSGMLINSGGPNQNAVRDQYVRLSSVPNSRHVAKMYIENIEGMLARFEQACPDKFKPAQKTVADDIQWMKEAFTEKYGREEDAVAKKALVDT